jgi:hypothetical protein
MLSPPQESRQYFSRNLQTGLDFFGVPLTIFGGGSATLTVGGYTAQIVAKRVAVRATVDAIIAASNSGPGEGALLTRAATARLWSNLGATVARWASPVAKVLGAFAGGYVVGTALGCATGILE